MANLKYWFRYGYVNGKGYICLSVCIGLEIAKISICNICQSDFSPMGFVMLGRPRPFALKRFLMITLKGPGHAHVFTQVVK